MRISDWSSDVCSSDLNEASALLRDSDTEKAESPDSDAVPANMVVMPGASTTYVHEDGNHSRSRPMARRRGSQPPAASSLPASPAARLTTVERARLIREAQAHSRNLADDPKEQALLDEIEDIQAENADALKP